MRRPPILLVTLEGSRRTLERRFRLAPGLKERVGQSVSIAGAEEKDFRVVEILADRGEIGRDHRDPEQDVLEELLRKGEGFNGIGRLQMTPTEADRIRSSTSRCGKNPPLKYTRSWRSRACTSERISGSESPSP